MSWMIWIWISWSVQSAFNNDEQMHPFVMKMICFLGRFFFRNFRQRCRLDLHDTPLEDYLLFYGKERALVLRT